MTAIDKYFQINEAMRHYDLEFIGKSFRELIFSSGTVELHFVRNHKGRVGHFFEHHIQLAPLEQVICIVENWRALESQLRGSLRDLPDELSIEELARAETMAQAGGY